VPHDAGTAARSSPGDVSPARPKGPVRNNPETKLLSALIAAPEWIAKAREEIAPSLLEISLLRELYEALLRREAPSDQIPDGLSPEAAAAWSYLKERAMDQSTSDAAGSYDRAAQILRGRPLYREMHALPDPGDKRRRRLELRTQFPAADAWYEYQKAARREARKTQRSRGT
jgi:hypothetical protein